MCLWWDDGEGGGSVWVVMIEFCEKSVMDRKVEIIKKVAEHPGPPKKARGPRDLADPPL
jgi:hypothetical protein